jgi:predicted MFS family arabinose efflux permease
MCWLAGAAMLVLVPLLRRRMPTRKRTGPLSYADLLRSVARLAMGEPVLRWRAAYGALSFAAFSGFWTAIPFLLASPAFGMDAAAIGAVALIGVPTAFAAPWAGRLADRGHGRSLTGMSLAVMVVGVSLTMLGTRHFGLIMVGGFLAVLGSGCVHITNQCLIYALDPEARNRLTTAYMSALFAGGMVGSALAGSLYSAAGWEGACGLLIALTAAAFGVWLLELASGARGDPRRAPVARPVRV